MKKLLLSLIIAGTLLGCSTKSGVREVLRNEKTEVISRFNEKSELTREEMAVLIQNGFDLVTMPYRTTGNGELKKSFISTETSMVTLETAIMPAASDVENDKWSKGAIETLLEARVMEIQNGNFNPAGKITKKEFAEILGKTIYGAEKKINHTEALQRDGFLPKNFELSDKAITVKEAGDIIGKIVKNKDFKIVSLFVTSDIHGHLQPYNAPRSEMKLGGMSRVATLVNEGRRRNENLLLLDAGDSPYNTNITNLFKGQPSVDVMNAMGYDATVLGNHDFDFVFENLLELARRADYKMLSANTYMADGTYPEEFKPYYVTEKDGVKIAIVGLTDDTTKLYTHFTNTENIEFKNQFETGKEVVAQAKNESDIVILLSHLHRNNEEILRRVPGIDISVGGGNDIFGRPEYVGETLMINPGAHSANVTQININILNKKMIGYSANQFVITEVIPQDEKVQKIIDDYSEKMGVLMGEVIGTATEDFLWSAPLVRTEESGLANIIADSQREYFNADFALQNGGGVRAAIPKGDVTLNSIFTTLPFDNRLILIETTGKQVRAALEHGVSQYPLTAGQFLQVSGLKYEFDGSKPAGKRIEKVTLNNGQPLDMNKTYKVVINDFMAGGGDGYSMFNVLNPTTGLTDSSKLIVQTNDFIRDVFANYTKKNKNIAPVMEERIKIRNPQKNNSKI